MSEAKVESKYIDKDPPMGTEQQLERKNNDYLAYLKEKLNFILATYGRRLTDADGHVNELVRTAAEFAIRLSQKVNGDEIISAINASPEQVTIQSNRINLVGVTVVNGKLVASYVGPVTHRRADYDSNPDPATNADFLNLRSIIQRGAPFSQAELDRYDFNGDGTLRMSDLIKLRNMILAGADEQKWRTVTIDPSVENVVEIISGGYTGVVGGRVEVTPSGVKTYGVNYSDDGSAPTAATLTADGVIGYTNGAESARYPSTGLWWLTPQGKADFDANSWTDGRFINVPFLTNNDLGIAASAGPSAVVGAWLKYIAEHYPSKQRCIFTGCVQASSYKMLQVLVYNTSAVDGTTGIPQYSMGFLTNYGGTAYLVGSNSYVAYATKIATGSGSGVAVETFTKSIGRSIAAGGSGSIDFTITKSGYTPIGITGIWGSGTTGMVWNDFFLVDNNTARIWYYNAKSSASTLSSLSIKVLYMQN